MSVHNEINSTTADSVNNSSDAPPSNVFIMGRMMIAVNPKIVSMYGLGSLERTESKHASQPVFLQYGWIFFLAALLFITGLFLISWLEYRQRRLRLIEARAHQHSHNRRQQIVVEVLRITRDIRAKQAAKKASVAAAAAAVAAHLETGQRHADKHVEMHEDDAGAVSNASTMSRIREGIEMTGKFWDAYQSSDGETSPKEAAASSPEKSVAMRSKSMRTSMLKTFKRKMGMSSIISQTEIETDLENQDRITEPMPKQACGEDSDEESADPDESALLAAFEARDRQESIRTLTTPLPLKHKIIRDGVQMEQSAKGTGHSPEDFLVSMYESSTNKSMSPGTELIEAAHHSDHVIFPAANTEVEIIDNANMSDHSSLKKMIMGAYFTPDRLSLIVKKPIEQYNTNII